MFGFGLKRTYLVVIYPSCVNVGVHFPLILAYILIKVLTKYLLWYITSKSSDYFGIFGKDNIEHECTFKRFQLSSFCVTPYN